MNKKKITIKQYNRNSRKLINKNLIYEEEEKKKKKEKRRFIIKLRSLSKDEIDYKNINILKKFLTKKRKIARITTTKLILKQQQLIAIEIKKARILSLLPYKFKILNPIYNEIIKT
uniref:ribosomal protein S18 n=1 Tax=Hydnora esculenta TaxID=1851369 RepID=UPI002115360A|nr:ribosomal protein S18 [Hydnora esculenta]USN93639.1 ribosomal protein S18 [Hydnora esculenta]